MHAENLAVKFKNAERAQAFQVVFKKCVVEVKAVPPPKGNLLMLFVDTFFEQSCKSLIVLIVSLAVIASMH